MPVLKFSTYTFALWMILLCLFSGTVSAKKEDGLQQLVVRLYKQPDFNLENSVAARNLLKQLNSGEIKLVRNAILARHQYQFKSHYLDQYFSQNFKSYDPVTKNITLTEQDEINVAIIKKAEEMIRAAESSEAGLRAQITGVWIPGPAIGGAAMPQNYTFKPDGTFIFSMGEGGCDERLEYSAGTWVINNKTLTMTTTHEKRYVGGKLIPVTDPVGCMSNKELVGGKWQVVKRKPVEVKRYKKLRFIYENFFGDAYFKPRFNMGKGEWWLYTKSITGN